MRNLMGNLMGNLRDVLKIAIDYPVLLNIE